MLPVFEEKREKESRLNKTVLCAVHFDLRRFLELNKMQLFTNKYMHVSVSYMNSVVTVGFRKVLVLVARCLNYFSVQ